jgi:hypothetical protein
MDPQRFDSLVQTLSTAASRRRALAALLTGLATPLLPGLAEADGGKGKGRGKYSRKRHGKSRGNAHDRKKQPAEASSDRVANAGQACREAGHPCEGNQTCCHSERVICVSSGPGQALRCTPCPDGQIACANKCIDACTASDQCHLAGVCDPATGACSDPKKPDGANCNDGNACTQTDACQDGVCVGRNPVVCTASDRCHLAGECDPRTGTCSDPTAPDGASCDDGNACTLDDVCRNGACAGSSKDCSRESDPCNDGACRSSDGACIKRPKADGTGCNADNTDCTVGDSCQNGTCTPGAGVDCSTQSDPCNTGVCRQSDGQCIKQPKADGTACGSGLTCAGGVCGCENNGFYCDGQFGFGTVCCQGQGTCEFTPPPTTEPGRKRCCYPDGTPCRSNEVFSYLGCCGGFCNTGSGTCSSTCTPSGGACGHPFGCCSDECDGLGTPAGGHCR